MRYKPDAVWHNFKPGDFPTMALGRRLDHPSRGYFYEWLGKQARQSAPTLAWCDVGVLSMVDYLNVRHGMDPALSARIVYTGLEIGEPIADVARERLLRAGDRVLVADLEEPGLGATIPDRFDVVSIRHVLNHCRYYEAPLRNAFDLLKPGGKVFVNLHMKCSEDRDILATRPMPGVHGEYIENIYVLGRFLRFFASLFAVESVEEIDSPHDLRNKPNQILIGIKQGYADRIRPEVITFRPSLLARARGALGRRWSAWA